MGLSKHGSPCYCRFDDFQGACARGGAGYMMAEGRDAVCRGFKWLQHQCSQNF